ncbi:MAG: hypothetical protein ABIQ95_03420 [Bdellovibrionia bacterium]
MRLQVSRKILKQTGVVTLISLFSLSSILLKSAYSMDKIKTRYKELVHEGKIAIGRNPLKAEKPIVPELSIEEARERKARFSKAGHDKWRGSVSPTVPAPPAEGLSRINTQNHRPPQLSPVEGVSPMNIPHLNKDNPPPQLPPIRPVSPFQPNLPYKHP